MASADDDTDTDAQPDLSLTVARAAEMLSASGLGSAEAVVPLQAGHASTVSRVDVDGPHERVVVKVYRPEFSWKQRKEVHVYRLLRDVAVPTPTVLGHGGTGTTADPVFLVLEWLPGTSPRYVPSWSTADSRAMYTALGGLLRQIHTVQLEGFGYVVDAVVGPQPTNAEFMASMFDRWLTGEVEVAGDPAIRAGARRLLDDTGSAFELCDSAVLCHDDIHLGNVLVDPDNPGRIVGLIDVENTFAADPLFDVAKTLLNLEVDRTTAFRQSFLDGYGPLGPRADERLRLYEIYHLLEFWYWVTSSGLGWSLAPVEEQLRVRVIP
jgi:aminoglycoside phosphotransferase (APT) family kinase protein